MEVFDAVGAGACRRRVNNLGFEKLLECATRGNKDDYW